MEPSQHDRASAQAMAAAAAPLLAELGPSHKPLILQHLLRLSADDRRLRFGVATGDAAISRYVGRIDFDRDIALGLVDESGRLLGFGHLVLDCPVPEFGISIDRAARGAGLGTLLLARASGHVRAAGKDRLLMQYLPENTPLANLAARAGMRLDVVDGEGLAILRLPPLADEDAAANLPQGLAQAMDLAFRLARAPN